jgi:ubiquinol-cytochrome c reductase iron-sulfur subunit
MTLASFPSRSDHDADNDIERRVCLMMARSLAALKNGPALADPNSEREQQPPCARNAVRSIKPEVVVVIGICTHLGCSPNNEPARSANPSLPAGRRGGFFCPCHGSMFDCGGRVYTNKPAPSNLEVPPYQFLADNLLRIGDVEA